MEEAMIWVWLPVTHDDEATLVNRIFRQQQPLCLGDPWVNGGSDSRVVKTQRYEMSVKREMQQRCVSQVIVGVLAAEARPLSEKELLHAVWKQPGVPKIASRDLTSALQSLCDTGRVCNVRRGRKNKLWTLSSLINDGL